jgi:hypothetical protein
MRIPHQSAPVIHALVTSEPVPDSLSPAECWSDRNCQGTRIPGKNTRASCCRGKDGGKGWLENGVCTPC